jgi:hypothetical protein
MTEIHRNPRLARRLGVCLTLPLALVFLVHEWPDGYVERVIWHDDIAMCEDVARHITDDLKHPSPSMLWGFTHGGSLPSKTYCVEGDGGRVSENIESAPR